MNACLYHTFRVPCRVKISEESQPLFSGRPGAQYKVDEKVVARVDPEGAVLVTSNHAVAPIFVDKELFLQLQKSPITTSSIPEIYFQLLRKAGILNEGTFEYGFPRMTMVDLPRLPFWSAIEIIAQCQCRCWPCYRQDDLDGFIPPLGDVIFWIKKMYAFGITFFEITGGEPLLRKDLVQILDYLRELNAHYILVTNGEYFKDASSDLLEALRSSHGVLISLDGIGVKHDMVRRRPGLFDNILRGLERLREYDVKIYFNSTLYDYNIDDVSGMLELAKKYGTTIQLRPAIKASATRKNQLQPAPITNTLKDLLNSAGAHNAFAAASSKMPPAHFYGCNTKKNVAVDVYGNLFPCIMDRFRSVGNLTNISLGQYAELIGGERQIFLDGNPSCRDCHYKKNMTCGGFCRFSEVYKKN